MRGITTLVCVLALPILGPGCLTNFDRPEPEPGHQHHDWDEDGYCEAEPCPGGLGSGDCDDEHPGVYPGAAQVCDDAVDNDCDGVPDPEEADGDLDGYSLCDGDCDDTDAFLDLEDADGDGDSTCTGDCDDGDAAQNTLDLDGDGYVSCDDGTGEVDCDDHEASVYPGAPDVCDDFDDNDCDGSHDALEVDNDGDGYSECEDDCDDGDPAVKPGAEEVCDGVDNDCNGTVDDGMDVDDDGDGYTICDGDCDDGDAALSPGAIEVCDGDDNDCDGTVDGSDCIDCTTVVPGYYLDIQSAIDSGSPETPIVVCVSPGTYTENLDFGGNSIHLVGTAGPTQTVVDAQGSGTVLRIASGEPAARVEGLTLTGGDNQRAGGVAIDFGAQVEMIGVHVIGNTASFSGGGIDLRDGSNSYLYLADSVIAENTITYGIGAVGGGMRIEENATAELMNVEFRDNEADQDGGAIWTAAGLSAHNLMLTGNEAGDRGAGLYATGGLVYITHLTATDNAAGNSGGAIYLTDSASLNLEDSTLAHNDAGGGGGAIYTLNYCNVYGINSRFVANSSDNQGGAIDLTSGSTAQFEAAVFAANTTGGDGGGIHMGTSTGLTLSHVSVVDNHADGQGGGVAVGVLGTVPVLSGVILANNSADGGGGALKALGTDMMLSYCSLWANGADAVSGMSDPVGQFGNVEVDPEFLDVVDPDPSLWDLHLGATSALIDQGQNDIQDPDGSRSDMGAYSGPRAGQWDRDDDGYYEWWQPGPYDTGTYPGLGWDCDDTDTQINADHGCS